MSVICAAPRAEWQFRTDFRELHSEFPELVDEDGCGWYIRHLHGISNFINANRDKVGKTTHKLADNIERLEDAWRKKVIQFQIPIFSEGTKGDLILRFDDVIADALELGALRREPIRLTDEQEQWLAEMTPSKVPLHVTRTIFEYYTEVCSPECDKGFAGILYRQQTNRQRLVRPARDECGSVSR